MVVMAMIGRAAHLVNGHTIYSALGFKVINHEKIGLNKINNFQRDLFKHCKIIFIDEVSLLGKHMFCAIYTTQHLAYTK